MSFISATAKCQREVNYSAPFDSKAMRHAERLQKCTNTLLKGLFDECFIPLDTPNRERNLDYTFACILTPEGVKVRSATKMDAEADFYVIANVNASQMDDSSIDKSIRAFFRGLGVNGYACTLIQRIDLLFSKHIHPGEINFLEQVWEQANAHYAAIRKDSNLSYQELPNNKLNKC